ncbi:hypothetical protein [Pseudaestuariivita rosea]|uniref:hypothetical protein n=1 Tax=Pseudaestuariivita rosea TaxID=2763263 RepID=UPI001ABB0054|nr:hypothetical protein [Pseudaestuariivita rosea]
MSDWFRGTNTMNAFIRSPFGIVRMLLCGLAFGVLIGCATSPVQRDAEAVSSGVALMANTDSNGDACILDEEFSVNGVTQGAPESIVLDRLGEPQERRPIPPGSDLPFNSIVYQGLIVYLFQNQVAELTITDPAWQSPSGLRVGLTRAELINVLGQVPEIRSDLPSELIYEIPPCQDQTQAELAWSFLIFVDDSGTVKKIMLQGDWP